MEISLLAACWNKIWANPVEFAFGTGGFGAQHGQDLRGARVRRGGRQRAGPCDAARRPAAQPTARPASRPPAYPVSICTRATPGQRGHSRHRGHQRPKNMKSAKSAKSMKSAAVHCPTRSSPKASRALCPKPTAGGRTTTPSRAGISASGASSAISTPLCAAPSCAQAGQTACVPTCRHRGPVGALQASESAGYTNSVTWFQ